MIDQDDTKTPRSPLRALAEDSALLVIDVQEKLTAAMPQADRLIFNCRRLAQGARTLDVPVVATEQYPEGLGPTVAPILEQLDRERIGVKKTFSCGPCGSLFSELRQAGRDRIVVCGIEAHVCVLQTVLDLLADGWMVHVAVDAVTSRFDPDYQTALRRMESSGAVLVTVEMALFEWCETADRPEFKAISRLVRETPPA